MSEEANLIQRFKSNKGLSNKDLSTIFQVSSQKVSGWTKGLQVDPKAEAVALALNVMMERWKKEGGMSNSVDYQHLMKNAENLQKENDQLREQLKYRLSEVGKWANSSFASRAILRDVLNLSELSAFDELDKLIDADNGKSELIDLLKLQLASKDPSYLLAREERIRNLSEKATQDAVYLANNTKEDIHIPVTIEVV